MLCIYCCCFIISSLLRSFVRNVLCQCIGCCFLFGLCNTFGSLCCGQFRCSSFSFACFLSHRNKLLFQHASFLCICYNVGKVLPCNPPTSCCLQRKCGCLCAEVLHPRHTSPPHALKCCRSKQFTRLELGGDNRRCFAGSQTSGSNVLSCNPAARPGLQYNCSTLCACIVDSCGTPSPAALQRYCSVRLQRTLLLFSNYMRYPPFVEVRTLLVFCLLILPIFLLIDVQGVRVVDNQSAACGSLCGRCACSWLCKPKRCHNTFLRATEHFKLVSKSVPLVSRVEVGLLFRRCKWQCSSAVLGAVAVKDCCPFVCCLFLCGGWRLDVGFPVFGAIRGLFVVRRPRTWRDLRRMRWSLLCNRSQRYFGLQLADRVCRLRRSVLVTRFHYGHGLSSYRHSMRSCRWDRGRHLAPWLDCWLLRRAVRWHCRFGGNGHRWFVRRNR